jgi:hypothetical protein
MSTQRQHDAWEAQAERLTQKAAKIIGRLIQIRRLQALTLEIEAMAQKQDDMWDTFNANLRDIKAMEAALRTDTKGTK